MQIYIYIYVEENKTTQRSTDSPCEYPPLSSEELRGMPGSYDASKGFTVQAPLSTKTKFKISLVVNKYK